MDFKQALYQYISENCYYSLIQNESYQQALANRRIAESKLTETLSKEQQALLETFINELASVCEMETYFYFCEALSVFRKLLTA